jgi:copper resistance protein B
MIRALTLTITIALLVCASSAFAQGTPTPPDPHAGHTMPPPAPASTNTSPPSSVAPVPPVTDQDRAAAFPQDLHGHTVHDRAVNYFVLFDQLEWQDGGGTAGLNWDTKAWIGGDVNRIWIHSEGASEKTRLEEAEFHVTYGRAISRWWDVVAGIRHDLRPEPGQTWAAVGIQGLAPQRFDVQATFYVGERAATLARFETEYDMLITNRLVFQPLMELNIYGKEIVERGIGAGLSSAEAGLRLRYEIRRELAPYVGLVWHRQFGATADFSREAGDDIGGWRVAAGVRTWF